MLIYDYLYVICDMIAIDVGVSEDSNTRQLRVPPNLLEETGRTKNIKEVRVNCAINTVKLRNFRTKQRL
jgi:ribosome recycling factor